MPRKLVRQTHFRYACVTCTCTCLVLSYFTSSATHRKADSSRLLVDPDTFATQARWKELNLAADANKYDFDALLRLLRLFRSNGLNSPSNHVLVGGTNEGAMASLIIENCPKVHMHGFEIQKALFNKAKARLNAFPNAHMYNMGWSDVASTGQAIGGEGETAGIYDPKGQRGASLSGSSVNTTSLADWLNSHNIDSALYIVIDTEGHEPKVIRGMGLHNIVNRKKVPIFQFELGGTWAERDNRHGGDTWTQHSTAKFLDEMGYDLFLISSTEWIFVRADFFDPLQNVAIHDEGFGPFVQGNLLAVHRIHVHQGLRRDILKQSIVFIKAGCTKGENPRSCRSLPLNGGSNVVDNLNALQVRQLMRDAKKRA